ncbi:MAG: MFS transporter [Firmicutes bacterium]|nr:MFS transporter [Bacillota bacterium]
MENRADGLRDEVKPKLWTRNYVLLCLSSLLMFLHFHSLIPTLPLYMEIYGGKSSAAGFPMAALTLGAVLIRPAAGWALDVYGRKRIFLAGLLLFLLPAVLYVWMIPAYLLIVLRFVQGIGWGIGNTASNTVASDIIPLKRIGEGTGIFMITLALPMAISPGVSLWIVDHYSFPLLFAVSSSLIFLSFILVLFIKFPRQEKQKRKPKFVFWDRSSARPALVILFFTISHSSVISFLPVYAKQQGIEATGLFFAAMAVSTLIVRPAAGMFVDKQGERGYNLAVALGALAVCLALGILAQTASAFHLVAGGIFYGVGFGMGQPALLALTIMHTPAEKKGAANATYWTAYDIGIAIGSVVWGLVAAATGYREMFYLNIIPMLLVLLIYFTKLPFLQKNSIKETEADL